ncbi:hypothetical protein [Pilimelia columellifera]|uniref:Homoserine dehydrogenase n=1 Tax=Pilimelia columellifera subsp. columellifera TaxID=706583 RepID=A0ABN3NDH6_9ACTN
MSALLDIPLTVVRPAVAVALLGTGVVGGAFLDRWSRLSGLGLLGELRLVHVANSRHEVGHAAGLDPGGVRDELPAGRAPMLGEVGVGLPEGSVVVDATASDDVARWHPLWLEAGLRVVTANKAGVGGDLARYRAIDAHRAHYGDSATVGAGLPLLRSLRSLRAGGDRVHAIAGVLSGSLAWLLDAYDGSTPFSELVRQARRRGLTEPDPRQDLSGADVLRKLLILARAAGRDITTADVVVTPLAPAALATAPLAGLDAALSALDEPLRRALAAAAADGRRLRFVARLDADGGARVGLEALAPDDPLAGGGGCDNRVSVWSDRYADSPLVIQGPGAGAEVTAAALIDDILRVGGG